ncbi:MAG: flavin reductase family protein [Mycobacteriales bacterium]
MTTPAADTSEADVFRAAIGSFVTGVTVVTIRDDDDDIGITSTAFASVSLQPPLVMVTVNTESYVDEVLHRRDAFAVSILAATQTQVASRFAVLGRPSARLLLADLPHHRGVHSAALIVDDGLAALECRARERIDAGDHTIVVAGVVAIDYRSDDRAPLLHFRGRYRHDR